MELTALSVAELLKLHSAVGDALRERGVLRTGNNPVGDYVEWLVSNALSLTLTKNSAAGYDAVAADGRKIQIKGRRLSKPNASRQLGVIRNLEKGDFDDLIAVVLDNAYDVVAAYLIPHGVISEHAPHNNHVNGRILHIRGKLLLDSQVVDITEKIKAGMPAEPSKVSQLTAAS